jgi:hypothetical protein
MVFVERQFTTQIDEKDPNVLYSPDMPATLKSILIKMYVGKCFKRCYVTEILEIDEYSPPVLEAMRNGGSARIAVQFRVRGLVYDRFEVIPDAKIVEITETGKMVLRSRHAAIMIAADPRLQHFRVGMIVPVRVVDARYIAYRDTISVSGIPFIPLHLLQPEQADEFEVQLTTEDMHAIEPMLARVADVRKRFETNASAKHWQDLLDPKKSITDPQRKGFKQVDIAKVRGHGRIVRPEWTPLSDMSVWWQDAKDGKANIKNSATVVKGYLASMLKQLELAISLATQYDWAQEKDSPWVALYRAEKGK